ncbi:MAG: hypothetical protein DWQ07_19860 [Chloroflexi bacterium]|nr:MAG: hypothetical protein DWQ07_19860 [Chloroflexota bacterium]MBL1194340.1 hypothetical protein [Chloroflexota bacterium]NOH11630.1 hypothetical protein [Chloroflexota bacterium]
MSNPPNPNEELPDWLNNLNSGDDGEDATPQDDSSKETLQSGLPHWLQGNEEEEAQAEPEPQEEAIPDWIKNTAPTNVAEDQPDAPPEEDEDAPEWLDNIRQAETEAKGEQEPDGEGGDPDWLNQIRDRQQMEAPPASEGGGEGRADYIERIREREEEEKQEKRQVIQEPEEDPGWVTGLRDKQEEETGSGIGELESPTPALIGDVDEGLERAAAEVDAEFPDLPGEPAQAGVLPPWLDDLRSETPQIAEIEPSGEEKAAEAQPAPSEEAIDDPNLEEADLPSWLQAMRPQAGETPALVDETPEEKLTIGPLAGLRSVLPAEPEIVQFGKPPSITVQLQSDERQERTANLFARLIETESRPKVKNDPIAPLRQGFLRWIITGLLLFALALPVLGRANDTALPNIAPSAQMSYDLVYNLLPGENILVAVDYQPGLAGEMDAAAGAVIDFLIIKGAKLTFISTDPNGPLQIERFLRLTQIDEHTYVQEKEYLNLGYLAGGTTALAALASDPRSAISGTTELDDESINVWEHPNLADISLLSDFSMVVVITDDNNTARAWIEQAGPMVSGTDLNMVLSAQAEPLIRPYYERIPRQVNGLVAGLQGGAFYERSTGRDGLARNYWDTFGAGLTITIFIILFGSAYSVVSHVLRRNRGLEEEARR